MSVTLGNFRSLSQQSQRSGSGLGALQNKAANLASETKKSQGVSFAEPKSHSQSKSVTVAQEILRNKTPVMAGRPNEGLASGEKGLQETQSSKALSQTGRSLIWNNQTVDRDIKTCYHSFPNVQPETEAEYYENVRRLDECGHCWSNNQKYYNAPFKLKQKGPSETLYQKDFVPHPIEQGPKVKNDFYTTFKTDEPHDFQTTMGKDYQPHKVGPIKKESMAGKSAATGVPFGGRSGYKTEYINWGNIPVNIEKPPVNISVISEVPFRGKSVNTEVYCPQNGKPARPVDRDLLGTKRSPLSPGIPFMGQSTHNATYKPHGLESTAPFFAAEEYEPSQTYPKQFKTLYQKDFPNHDAWKCPAKIYMETHPHPKAKYLKP